MSTTGRNTKYTPEVVARIVELVTQGTGEIKAARLAGISKDTYFTWKKQKPDFSDAIKVALQEYHETLNADLLQSAGASLKKLVEGYDYEETKIEYIDDPRNPGAPKIKQKTVTRKHVQPQTGAVVFALTNRAPEYWKNRVSNEITGDLKTETKSDVALDIPDDVLFRIADELQKYQHGRVMAEKGLTE